MSLFLNCIPQGWLPFADPKPSANGRDSLLKLFIERAEHFAGQHPFPTAAERHPGRLLWYLIKANFELEPAYQRWLEWVKWCRTHKTENISTEAIQMEIDTKVAYWKGCDKLNRPTCVITGRNHDPYGREGNWQTFKQFMIYIVEEGLRAADQRLFDAHLAQLEDAGGHVTAEPRAANGRAAPSTGGSPRQHGLLDSDNDTATEADAAAAPGLEAHGQVCILYDRRGLGDEHLDPNLYQICRDQFGEMQAHYGERLGLIYVVHINWFFWLLYQYIMQPFLEITGRPMVQVVETPEELLAKNCFASESELHLQSYTAAPAPVSAPSDAEAGVPTTPTPGPNTQQMMETLKAPIDPITGFTAMEGVAVSNDASTSTAGTNLQATASAASIDR